MDRFGKKMDFISFRGSSSYIGEQILIHYPKVQFFRPEGGMFEHHSKALRPGPQLHIFQTGLREEFSAEDCDRPLGTPHYYFFVHFDHAMRIWDGERMVEASPGSTLLWAPGFRQRYGAIGGQVITHSYIFARGRVVDSMVRTLRLPLNRILSGVNAASFETHIFPLVSEYMRAAVQPAIIENCVSNLLHSIASDLARSDVSRADQRLLDIKRRLELDPAGRHRLTDLAKAAHLTPSYLSDAFKRAFGRSPIEHLISLRMTHARHLLATTNLAVKEIAVHLGYGDPYFFSRLFKRHCGCSPRAFRRRRQKA
jgi:AraC family transcriptional regulator of arabinose operon